MGETFAYSSTELRQDYEKVENPQRLTGSLISGEAAKPEARTLAAELEAQYQHKVALAKSGQLATKSADAFKRRANHSGGAKDIMGAARQLLATAVSESETLSVLPKILTKSKSRLRFASADREEKRRDTANWH